MRLETIGTVRSKSDNPFWAICLLEMIGNETGEFEKLKGRS